MKNVTLSNGNTIPALGLGTWRSTGDDAYRAVRHALDVGYRHIDTAEAYYNEELVGRALSDSGVPREQIFLTTKLWNTHGTTESARDAIDDSLARLGTEYVDLYLIHWPGSYERNTAVWRAIEAAKENGKVRAIGVSNFNIHHLDNLLSQARIRPVINQVECHPHLQNVRLLTRCAAEGIALEAYAPLASDHIGDLLADETLTGIASGHGKTVPQVVLRWHVQRGVIALPKSVTPARIEENLDVFDFELTDEEMTAIRRLNQAAKHFPEPDNVDFGFGIE